MATFNRITLDIPDGWDDGTMVTLLGPAPPTLDLKSHKTAETPERPNLVIRRLPVTTTEVSLQEFAAAQEEVMRSLLPDLKVLDRQELEIAGSPAVVREFAFTAPPNPLRQWQLYLYADGAFFVVCGTAMNDARFETERARFLTIARSLRFA